MTRHEVDQQFNVDEHGLISDSGKFEREPLYVPFFWESSLDGGADEDHGKLQGFKLTADDVATFPEYTELKAGAMLWLLETDIGFVVPVSDDEAKARIAQMEADQF